MTLRDAKFCAERSLLEAWFGLKQCPLHCRRQCSASQRGQPGSQIITHMSNWPVFSSCASSLAIALCRRQLSAVQIVHRNVPYMNAHDNVTQTPKQSLDLRLSSSPEEISGKCSSQSYSQGQLTLPFSLTNRLGLRRSPCT
jgi:hypothetical protein